MSQPVVLGTFGPSSAYAGRRLLYVEGTIAIEDVATVQPAALGAVFGDPELTWTNDATASWGRDYLRSVNGSPLAEQQSACRDHEAGVVPPAVWRGYRTPWLWAAFGAAALAALLALALQPLVGLLGEGYANSIQAAGESLDMASVYQSYVSGRVWMQVVRFFAGVPVFAVLIGWARSYVNDSHDLETRDLPQLLIDGAKVAGALVLWLMPAFAITWLMGRVAGTSLGLSAASGSIEAARTNALAGLIVTVPMGVLVLVATFLVVMLFPVALARFTVSGRFGEMMSVQAVNRWRRSTPGYGALIGRTIVFLVLTGVLDAVIRPINGTLAAIVVNVVVALSYGAVLGIYARGLADEAFPAHRRSGSIERKRHV